MFSINAALKERHKASMRALSVSLSSSAISEK